MSNYTIKITKLSHYIGDSELGSFKKGQITKQEYEYSFQEYGEALDEYRNKCKASANSICVGVCFFSSYHNISSTSKPFFLCQYLGFEQKALLLLSV